VAAMEAGASAESRLWPRPHRGGGCLPRARAPSACSGPQARRADRGTHPSPPAEQSAPRPRPRPGPREPRPPG
jgi:hypothetical protein